MRGPNIPDDWKIYIMEQAIMDFNKPRMLLADEILEQMRQSRDVRDQLPERESIAKLISRARNHPKSKLDEPWSVGCLAKKDIPPEALPKVMFIYEKRLREAEQHFTIREALWIARLHETIDDLIWLEEFAAAYALRDWIDWVLHNPVYTRDLDITLIRYIEGKSQAEFKHPRPIHALPTWGWDEEKELEKNLRKKGYTLGIKLTREEVQVERSHTSKK
jgi:hypothetical protein